MIHFGNAKKITLASVIALIIWTFISVNRTAFDGADGFEYFNYIMSYVMAAGIWALLAFKFELSKRLYKAISLGLFALTPFFDMQISILLSGQPEFGLGIYFMNVLFYLMITAAFFAIFRSMKWAGIVTSSLCFVFSLATYVVGMLRGIPLIPNDFLAIGTAANVVSSYTFEWYSPMVVSSVLFMFVITLLCKFSFKPEFKYKNLVFAGSGVAMFTVLALVFSTINYTDVEMDIFDQAHANNTHGVVFSFFLNAKASRIEKPENYSAEEVEAELKLQDTDYAMAEKKPDILVIMNESFADMRVLGNLETNEEFMPFIKSMKKDTVKGELLVSPFGGYTCNSEFEFLTGMSMGLLPSGSAPYLQYVQMNYPFSVPNHFKKLGYRTIALHPYYANGWNRDKVYTLMGFDDFISMDNMGDYQNEKEFEYIRGYMSDRTSYSAVINQLENKKPGENVFLFNVTMQNHGGYSGQYKDFEPDIEITNLNYTYKEAEQYLSLIRESDRSFEELIYYLSNRAEPTIVLMFGDHQPAVEKGFFEELMGKTLDELTDEEMQARYRVPFIIWANFDIDDESYIKTSTNYLSNILMETAGLPKSEVNMFLDGVREEIPQINAMGHYDVDGIWYENNTSLNENLNKYRNLEYYMLKQKNKYIE